MRPAYLLDDVRTILGIYPAGTKVVVTKTDGVKVTIRIGSRLVNVHARILGDKPLITHCAVCGKETLRRKTVHSVCLPCRMQPAKVPELLVKPPMVAVKEFAAEYAWMKESGMAEARIAERLGMSLPTMQKRLERLSVAS